MNTCASAVLHAQGAGSHQGGHSPVAPEEVPDLHHDVFASDVPGGRIRAAAEQQQQQDAQKKTGRKTEAPRPHGTASGTIVRVTSSSSSWVGSHKKQKTNQTTTKKKTEKQPEQG